MSAPRSYRAIFERNVPATMRDGTVLYADVWRPDAPGKFPVLLARTPYDKVLWDVIKGIAGDDGECILSREDLAALAMMSTGQVSRCCKYLMSVGLLYGKFKRDPNYPQPVWHLRIPNLWKANVAWAEAHLSLASRVAWKKQQPAEPSPGDASKEPSPGDGGVWFFTDLAVTDQLVVIAGSPSNSDPQRVVVLDKNNGFLLHTVDVPGLWVGGLAVGNNVLYIGTKSVMRAYTLPDLVELWQEFMPVNDLAISDGFLFVATAAQVQAFSKVGP